MLVLNGEDRQLWYEGNENTKIVSTSNGLKRRNSDLTY